MPGSVVVVGSGGTSMHNAEDGIYVLSVGDSLPFSQPVPWQLYNWNVVRATYTFEEAEADVHFLIPYEGRVAQIEWVPIGPTGRAYTCRFFRLDKSKKWVPF